MLQNEALVAKIGFDPAENEPWKECYVVAVYLAERRRRLSFQGSFSAGSKPIFATKASFCSIFRDLQENHLLASKFCKIFAKNCKILATFLQNLQNFEKILKFFQNLPNFCDIFVKIYKICWREDDILVDLEKC